MLETTKSSEHESSLDCDVNINLHLHYISLQASSALTRIEAEVACLLLPKRALRPVT